MSEAEQAQQDKPVNPASFRVYARLLRYVRAHWMMFSLNILGFLLFASTQPMVAKLSEYVINALEGRADAEAQEAERSVTELPFLNLDFSWFTDLMPSMSDSIMMVPVYVVIIYFLRGVGLFVGNYAIAVVAENVVHKLRTEVFDSLTRLPASYFDAHSSGQLISKMTYNVGQVTSAATDALKIVLREGLTVIVVMVALLVMDWQLTMIFITIAPVIGIFVSIAAKRLRRLSAKLQTAMGSITSISSEMIGGYRVMRSFGGEHYERKRFFDASRYTLKQNLKMVFTSNLATSINQFIVAIALGILMLIALRFIGTEGAAALVSYMLLVSFLPKSLRQLSDVYSKIQKGLVAAHSVFEQLDESPERDEGSYEVERVRGEVTFRNLSFRYPGAEELVLNDINLDVSPGTTVALVGKSGSGKSTLVSLIPRYYDYAGQQGNILLDGRDINDYRLANLRQQIALVTQHVVLFNDTVYNNIAYGELAGKSEEEVLEAARNAHAWEFIEKLPEGIHTQIGEHGMRLSGGQRQRLSIARAFLKDAPILILDEATSALDSESENLIQDALEKVVRNRTTFVIAHRLSTIENADVIVVLDAGKIVEVGKHQELLANNSEYAKLHSSQFKDET